MDNYYETKKIKWLAPTILSFVKIDELRSSLISLKTATQNRILDVEKYGFLLALANEVMKVVR